MDDRLGSDKAWTLRELADRADEALARGDRTRCAEAVEKLYRYLDLAASEPLSIDTNIVDLSIALDRTSGQASRSATKTRKPVGAGTARQAARLKAAEDARRQPELKLSIQGGGRKRAASAPAREQPTIESASPRRREA